MSLASTAPVAAMFATVLAGALLLSLGCIISLRAKPLLALGLAVLLSLGWGLLIYRTALIDLRF